MEDIAIEEPIKYKVQLDSNGYYTGSYAEVGDLENSVEIDTLPEEADRLKLAAYKIVDGAWLFDEDRYNSLLAEKTAGENKTAAEKQISELQEKIRNINLKLTECATYQTLGLEKPYSVADLLADKVEKQNKITELEESL